MRFIICILFLCELAFANSARFKTLTWGAGENDTTYSLSYSANDTSDAFQVFPYTDLSLQIRTITFDADSACRISFYPLFSITGEPTGVTNGAGSYVDSCCGTKIMLRDSITATLNAWSPTLSISTSCPVGWCRIVADGSVATGHMNGGTTASTGVVRIYRYQPTP